MQVLRLVGGVCKKACATKLGTVEQAKELASGHPGMAGYIKKGFQIITF